MKHIHPTIKTLLCITAIIGFIAVILAIVGVATKNWVEVQGSTAILNETIYTQVLPNVTTLITQVLGGAPVATLINGIVKGAFDKVVANIGQNLEPTTYTLFDKSINAMDLPDLKSPQGLIIAGLCCLFIGSILAFTFGFAGLRRVVLSVIPLFFLIFGPILITIGYLLYAKVIVEDFGHELGITVHLGSSLMIIVVSSIVGYITGIFYALIIFHRHHHETRRNTVQNTGHVLVNSRKDSKTNVSAADAGEF